MHTVNGAFSNSSPFFHGGVLHQTNVATAQRSFSVDSSSGHEMLAIQNRSNNEVLVDDSRLYDRPIMTQSGDKIGTIGTPVLNSREASEEMNSSE